MIPSRLTFFHRISTGELFYGTSAKSFSKFNENGEDREFFFFFLRAYFVWLHSSFRMGFFQFFTNSTFNYLLYHLLSSSFWYSKYYNNISLYPSDLVIFNNRRYSSMVIINQPYFFYNLTVYFSIFLSFWQKNINIFV